MDILTVMKERLAEAEGDANRLRQAITELERGSGASPKTTIRSTRPSRSKPTTVRPVIPLGKLLTELRRHDQGASTAALAKRLGGEHRQILRLLREAEGDQVRREGERKETRWLLVTDEDRIAARAAELEARSGARRGEAGKRASKKSPRAAVGRRS